MSDKSVAVKTTAIESGVYPVDGSAYDKHTEEELGPSGSGGDRQSGRGVYEMGATQVGERVELAHAIDEIERKKSAWYAYLLTKDFWIVLVLGQVLCLSNTATSTFTTFLSIEGTSIPAFQSLFNYVLLFLVYASYTMYTYGPRRYFRLFFHEGLGWRYFILSFLDVQGNYFTVLAYRYTTILSAQLLNFWSIVCVVIISFTLLKVRYGWMQCLGILVACGGMGVLLASDHITGGTQSSPTQLKGDLFGLAGATFYGLSNVFEEWFVSKRPMYEVLGMMGLFGMLINGVQAGIFDRSSFRSATWNGKVGGYLTGYTLALFLFYTMAPIMLRMASAAFFDISLLTGNFWGTIIGIHVFGDHIYYLYPIAFCMILLGLVCYFLAGSMLGDSKKPWLGPDQDAGVAGIGTAKRKALKLAEHERAAAADGHLA
ncbi:MAG: hypothetical protein M1818_003251 [Claussenomyces sp. TS43310]|nr:MAG: hypothetical protein M1818_003251 [Claussenomyces sp. TS43310]